MEALGWQVYTARRGYRGQEIDILGLFDIICYKDGRFKLIQVKSNRCNRDTFNKLEVFKVDGEIVSTEVWIFRDYSRAGPNIKVIYGHC